MALFRRDLEASPATNEPGSGAERARAATRIAAGTRIEGVVRGATDLVVEGEIEGEVRVESAVTIAPTGRIAGLVEARSVHVAGAVEGDVVGLDRVELAPTARLTGDVSAPRVAIAEGAFLKGSVEMRGRVEAEPSTPVGRG